MRIILRSVRHRLQRIRDHREAGSVALFMAVFMLGLLMMAGLVLDGGAAIDARGRAADLAREASRAGADALDPGSLRAANPAGLRADPAAARAAADQVLSLAGATGDVLISGDTVTVQVTVPQRAAILSAVGIGDVDGHASATATVLHGTTTGGS